MAAVAIGATAAGYAMLPDAYPAVVPVDVAGQPAATTVPAAVDDATGETRLPSATPTPRPTPSVTPQVVRARPQPPDTTTTTRPVLGDLKRTGRFVVAAGPPPVAAQRRLFRYTVEVEQGLPVVPGSLAAVVDATLADKRSWGGEGYTFRRVSSGGDFRVLLATPATVDRLCAPLDTGGEVSCRNGQYVVLNAKRWLIGAATYGADLASYRRYMINHEVGHALGHGHVRCPGPGRLAPVMLQQTLGLDGCVPNPWPAASLTKTP